MSLDFKNTKGKAIKSAVETYTYSDGDNKLRLVGGVLPRYLYWLKGTNNKDIPVECLSFNREKEKFDNLEVDHVPAYYPGIKCQWSYAVNCIDPRDGKVKALNLKKKLFEAIITAAEDLGGDPTDPDTGWDVCFKRSKTGPLPFNIEYTLQVLKCKVRPLTEEERAAVAAAPNIDQKYPRQSPDEVKALLERLSSGQEADDAPGKPAEVEAVNELSS
jgi:hypothetical protein